MTNSLNSLMKEKMKIIEDKKIIEKKHYRFEKKYSAEHGKVDGGYVGRWSYPNVFVKNYKDYDMPEWEINGHTIKALERRELIKPIEFREGKYGVFAIKYVATINSKDEYKKILNEIESLMDAAPNTEEINRLDILVTVVEEHEKTAFLIDTSTHKNSMQQV